MAQGPNLNPGMTQKATTPLRLPGLFQDSYHSLAGHLSPSLQDEAGTILILKKERDVERSSRRLSTLDPSEGPPLSGPQGPQSPDLGPRGQSRTRHPPPTHTHTTKILQSRNQLILEIQTIEPSFNLQGFCRPPRLPCPATVVTARTQ